MDLKVVAPLLSFSRDVEAEAEAGSGPFSVEAEAKARKFYRFSSHIDYLT